MNTFRWLCRKYRFLDTITFRCPELLYWTELVYEGYPARVIFN